MASFQKTLFLKKTTVQTMIFCRSKRNILYIPYNTPTLKRAHNVGAGESQWQHNNHNNAHQNGSNNAKGALLAV